MEDNGLEPMTSCMPFATENRLKIGFRKDSIERNQRSMRLQPLATKSEFLEENPDSKNPNPGDPGLALKIDTDDLLLSWPTK